MEEAPAPMHPLAPERLRPPPRPGAAVLLPVLVVLCIVLAPAGSAATPERRGDDAPKPMDHALALLLERSFDARLRAVDLLAGSGDPRARPLLEALLAGRLWYRKKDRLLVIAERAGDRYELHALTGEPLGKVPRRSIRKVSVNNRVRSRIRAALARLDLLSPDREVRLRALEQMLEKPDPAMRPLLARAGAREEDPGIRSRIEVLLALGELAGNDPEGRAEAARRLGASLAPAVRLALARRLEAEEDPRVRAAIEEALTGIEQRLALYRWAETAFFGLSLGSVLVLSAIGLAVTFGVMGVINMAHGELIMLGAYTAWGVQQLMPEHLGLSVPVAIPAAFLVSGGVGIAIERGIIRHLYGRPLETLLVTFGLSLVLQQAVRTLFSPLNRSVVTPGWMSGSLVVDGALSLTWNRLYVIAFGIAVFALLLLVLKGTRLGLEVRAVAQNRDMARALGVRSHRVDALTFGLGSGIAGVAGVALSQLTNVGPNLGQAYIVDSFMVVVFGGVGNLWGTLVGGLTLGIVNQAIEPWAGAVVAKVAILVFIILFIQRRPRGLFPQRGRAAEGV